MENSIAMFVFYEIWQKYHRHLIIWCDHWTDSISNEIKYCWNRNYHKHITEKSRIWSITKYFIGIFKWYYMCSTKECQKYSKWIIWFQNIPEILDKTKFFWAENFIIKDIHFRYSNRKQWMKQKLLHIFVLDILLNW